ncbi:MAG: carboxylesterase family protein [Deltaproteobacteria bacterium]|nr:carboxylesterase family protein [Deltaproteobacteria bacterium]
MNRMALLLLVSLLALSCGSEPSPSPPPTTTAASGGGGAGGGDGGGGQGGDVVVTTGGPAKGTSIGEARAWLGIPYAAPPLGALRFKAAQPVVAWAEPREASEVGPICPQRDMMTGKYVSDSSEDCLTLNVWAPSAAPGAPLPVMVWLHGGGFVVGSGHGEGTYSGEHLAPAGPVVLVTVNYRLGPLGFLAHTALSAEDPGHPWSGNYGLEDQRFALEWVRDNIAAFGGDPTNVTIFGESAGGISVVAHLVSPQSKGLFARAVVQSGPAESLMMPLAWGEAQGADFAKTAGCEGDGAKAIACLRAKKAEEIVAAQPQEPFLFGSGPSWAPWVDGHVLPEAGPKALAAGDVNAGPVLLGSNKDEGTLFIALAKLGDITEQQYAQIVKSLPYTAAHADAVLGEYPASAYDKPADALTDVVGHGLFNCSTRRTARALRKNGAQVFLYYFTREVDFVLGDWGAFHSAELAFLFGTKELGVTPLAAEDKPLSEAMMGYWTRFAQGGDPNGAGAVVWPEYDQPGDQHLVLDLAIATGSDLLADKCDFWDSIAPK